MKTPDVSKLPVWAQKRIEGLEHKVEYLTGQLKKLSTFEEIDPDVAHDVITFDPMPMDLTYVVPSHRIRLYAGYNWLDVKISDHLRNAPAIEVRSEYGVRVQPAAYNTILVIPEDPHEHGN